MRIFGGHDYYDSIQGVIGVSADDPVKFVRTNKILTAKDIQDHHYTRTRREYLPFDNHPVTHFKNFYYLNRDLIRSSDSYVQVYAFEVYFCGKVYTGYRVTVSCLPPYITYSYTSLIKYLRKYTRNKFDDTPRIFGRYSSWDYKGDSFVDIISSDYLPATRDYFIRNKLAIATNETGAVNDMPQVQLNGYNLGKLNFVQIKDPFTAYQELEHWISNDLACQVDGPDIIDDKIKIQKHGFDLKTSFRHPVKLKDL